MPLGRRHLTRQPHSRRKHHLSKHTSRLTQHPKHILIRLVIASTKDEVEVLGVISDEATDDFALVDVPRADFEIGFAGKDLNGVFGDDGLFEVGLKFARLPKAVFRISVAVMPGQCTAFTFYLGSYIC